MTSFEKRYGNKDKPTPRAEGAAGEEPKSFAKRVDASRPPVPAEGASFAEIVEASRQPEGSAVRVIQRVTDDADPGRSFVENGYDARTVQLGGVPVAERLEDALGQRNAQDVPQIIADCEGNPDKACEAIFRKVIDWRESRGFSRGVMVRVLASDRAAMRTMNKGMEAIVMHMPLQEGLDEAQALRLMLENTARCADRAPQLAEGEVLTPTLKEQSDSLLYNARRIVTASRCVAGGTRDGETAGIMGFAEELLHDVYRDTYHYDNDRTLACVKEDVAAIEAGMGTTDVESVGSDGAGGALSSGQGRSKRRGGR